jgi:hypothetical protein
MNKPKQTRLYEAIQKLAPASLTSTYSVDDLISDSFLSYAQKFPGYLEGTEELDLEQLKSIVKNFRIARNRHKYRVHSTANMTAEDLEQFARGRVVIEEEVGTTDTFELLRDIFINELARRNIQVNPRATQGLLE